MRRTSPVKANKVSSVMNFQCDLLPYAYSVETLQIQMGSMSGNTEGHVSSSKVAGHRSGLDLPIPNVSQIYVPLTYR